MIVTNVAIESDMFPLGSMVIVLVPGDELVADSFYQFMECVASDYAREVFKNAYEIYLASKTIQ